MALLFMIAFMLIVILEIFCLVALGLMHLWDSHVNVRLQGAGCALE
jgi:hypothetical protein